MINRLRAAAQGRECGRGGHQLVADAGRLDDDVVEGDVEHLSPNRRDHVAAFTFAANFLRCSTTLASAAAIRAIIGARQQ